MSVVYLISLMFFCIVIPFGIYLAFLAYRLGKKIFNPHIILEMPFKDKEAVFYLEKSGRYSIWQKGKLFSKTPVDQFKPQIVNLDSNRVIPLSRSILRPSINGTSMGSMELFNFKATSGNYKLEIVEGSSVFLIESILTKSLSSALPQNYHLDKYSLLIRKRLNPFLIFGLVWLIILSIGLIVGGLTMGLAAEKIFTF